MEASGKRASMAEALGFGHPAENGRNFAVCLCALPCEEDEVSGE